MVKWISHRGESYDAPENTLAAFRLSRERGTDGMECDVRLTADGKVAVAHDANTDRMGSALLEVEQSIWADLRRIEAAGSFVDRYPGEKIPLLEEAFALLGPGREFYIELKGSNPALVPAVREVLHGVGAAPEQIIVIAFDRQLLKLSKMLMPEYRTLWLTDLKNAEGRRLEAEELLGILRELHADGVNSWAHPGIDAELVEQVHREGKLFAVWTVDNPAVARRLIAAGVDAVTSNRAAHLRDLPSQPQ